MKEIDIIIGKYLTGDCSEEELKTLGSWREDEENEASFQLLIEAWESTDDIAKSKKDDDWKAVMDSIDVADDRSDTSQGKSVLFWPLSIAASLAVFIGLVFFFGNDDTKDNTIADVFSTKATKQDFALPDGTVVTLDRFSTLYLKEFTDSQRLVELKGQAFFNVEKDKRRPFIVRTACSSTQVLGTQFSVKENGEQGVNVAVKEGKVSLTGLSKSGTTLGKVFLLPNDLGNVTPTEQKVRKMSFVDDLNMFSWKTGELNFKNTALAQVSKDLGRHYNFKFTFENIDKSVKLTASFNQKSIDEIIDLIAAATNKEASIKEDEVVFK